MNGRISLDTNFMVQIICVVSLISLVIAAFTDLITILITMNNLPAMMQGIGSALLIILIPLGIVIFEDVHKKRRKQNIGFAELDLHVVTDEVFNFWRLLVYVALIFLPTIFWEVSTGVARFIEIISFGVGITLLVMMLRNIYSWIKGPFEFRFSYLRNLKGPNDMKVAWDSVWQTKSKDFLNNETKFFEIFSTTIDKSIKFDGELETPSKLLDNFKNFINNRLVFSLVSETLPKILEWHYRTWKIEKNSSVMKKKSDMEKLYIFEIHDRLSFVVKNIEERALKGSGLYSPFSSYTKDLKQHSQDYKNEEKYLGHLFAIFYRVFFENIESSPECETIWVNFPEEWKVGKKWLDENNFMSRLTLEQFLKLAAKRIPTDKKEHDRKLDIVSYSLFPEVEPIVWAKLLIFLFALMTPNNKVKCVIEHPWNFGLTGMPSGGYRLPKEDDETDARKAHEEEVRNAFELATILHEYTSIPKDTFSEASLEGYIKDLEGLEGKYKDDPVKEVKRAGLLNVFTKMLDFLHDRDKKVA